MKAKRSHTERCRKNLELAQAEADWRQEQGTATEAVWQALADARAAYRLACEAEEKDGKHGPL